MDCVSGDRKSSLAAITFAINSLPTAFVLPFAGAFVENRNKKEVMVICDFIRGSLVALTLILFYMDKLSTAMILLLTFSISLTEAFRIPGSTSFILQVLPEEEREEGITFNILFSGNGSYNSYPVHGRKKDRKKR